MEGHNIDLFINTPLTDDICGICNQVCRDIVETDCGHPFCEGCLQSWIQQNSTCPIDRKELSTGNFKSSNLARRRISCLITKCPNTCDAQVAIKDLEDHLANKCQEREITCAICAEELKAKELEEHINNAIVAHIQALALKINVGECKTEIDSIIITEEKHEQFFSLISRRHRKPQFKLIFRGSRDGFSSETFHQKCDNRGPTLTVVLAKEKIFGGFNPRCWHQQTSYYQDCAGLSWLFSLENNSIIDNNKGTGEAQSSIYSNSGYGPTFGGGHDLHICTNCNTVANSYTQLGYSYDAKFLGLKCGTTAWTYFCGSRNFLVTDYEVFALH